MQPVFENVNADVAAFLLSCDGTYCSHSGSNFTGTIHVVPWGIHISQSPRRLRAKYTHCTNYVYAMGISPLQGARSRLRDLIPPQGGYVRKRAAYAAHSHFHNRYCHIRKGGESTIQRHSFIQMSKLHDVRGRITYISSRAKQENLYAVYETTERSYWRELAKCNQEEFKKSGTEGKCIEARELIIALPESFPNLYDPNKLLQLFTDRFKEKYGAECIAALHHNKRKTNYHIHLIFSERELLPEPIEKAATRNMFYDENGKHVRTKKEILDGAGQIRKGCRIVQKGEVYERILFSPKNKLFKQETFVDEAKHFYTDIINLLVRDEKEKLHVFDKDGLYHATKKIGKNNPKAEQIQADNEKRMKWNREVDRAIVSNVPEAEIGQIKREYITDRIKTSVDTFGNQPQLYGSIISTAITVLALLISKVLRKTVELSEKFTDTKQEQALPLEPTPLPKAQKPAEKKIPPKPIMTAKAADYPKLHKIYKELVRQNEIIFAAEKERNALEEKLGNLKGLTKLTKKGELQSEIEWINERIDLLKVGLSGIAKRYGYQTVQDFYRAYHTAKNAYADYQKRAAKWEETFGTKVKSDTIHDRIQSYQREESTRQSEWTTQRKSRRTR